MASLTELYGTVQVNWMKSTQNSEAGTSTLNRTIAWQLSGEETRLRNLLCNRMGTGFDSWRQRWLRWSRFLSDIQRKTCRDEVREFGGTPERFVQARSVLTARQASLGNEAGTSRVGLQQLNLA